LTYVNNIFFFSFQFSFVWIEYISLIGILKFNKIRFNFDENFENLELENINSLLPKEKKSIRWKIAQNVFHKIYNFIKNKISYNQ